MDVPDIGDHGPMERPQGQTLIIVFQDRSWFGDPRLGAFVLSIDGRRAGVVRVQDSLTVSLQPGQHALRIRQWWYRSPAVSLDVSAAQQVRLRADIDRTMGGFRRWLRFMFTPWKALVLATTA